MAIRYWLGVAQRENVRRGVALGFAQAGYRQRPTLEDMRECDGVVYYSPKTGVEGETLREFTAIGFVAEGPAYEASDVGAASAYRPWRRRIDYDTDAVGAPIRPLLPVLDLTRDDPDWGFQLRRGLLEITRHDYDVIRRQMRRH